MNGDDSMSPTVPPNSITHASGASPLPSAEIAEISSTQS